MLDNHNNNANDKEYNQTKKKYGTGKGKGLMGNRKKDGGKVIALKDLGPIDLFSNEENIQTSNVQEASPIPPTSRFVYVPHI